MAGEFVNLEKFIADVIAGSYLTTPTDQEYQSNFANEGERKATYILEDLRYKESKALFSTSELCYLSIGGADGSEVEWILKNSSISKGILIEISQQAVDSGVEKAKKLKAEGKELVIIKGDVFYALDECNEHFKRWRDNNDCNGLVVSAQAVLHELPVRSKDFDLVAFLGKPFLYDWPTALFYSREPCAPVGWPEKIRLRIDGVSNEQLKRFALLVRDRLKMKGEPTLLPTNWLGLESVLAIETLHKLIREGSQARVEYELGEQLTSLEPMNIKKQLESLVEGMMVQVDYITTLGFKKALSDYKVEYQGYQAESLPVPKTHVEIIGMKNFPPSAFLNFPFNADQAFLPSVKTQFNNPFKNVISNEAIEDWLVQFDHVDQPIIKSLVTEFVYIDQEDLNQLLVKLYNKLEQNLGENLNNAVFVPLGDAGKSGGLITYFFRLANNIDSERFKLIPQLTTDDFERKTIVLLDDLLASGHQAVHQVKGLPTNADIRFAVAASTDQGEIFFSEHTGFDVITALHIQRADLMSEDQNTNVIAILEKYGKHVAPKAPLGYSGSALLLAFEYNVPDNTLPIFWSTHNGWKPLLHSKGHKRITFN